MRNWLPAGFARYARILHPAYVHEETSHGIVYRRVTWRELGQWSGKGLTASTCIDDLLVRGDGLSWHERGSPPDQGRLDARYLNRLVNLLVRSPSVAEEVWLLVWAGHASARTVWRGDAEVELNSSWKGTGRTYLLFRGTIAGTVEEDADIVRAEPRQPMVGPPSFWWPAHPEWFVSTDIDSFATYVGGPASLVNRLLEDDVLEAVLVDLDDPFDPCVEG